MSSGDSPLPAEIVVVDDDSDVREALVESLRDEGFSVNGFGSGRSAVTHLKSAPDTGLVLLDWMMPGMSGGDVLKELSEDQALKRIPVVVITANVRLADGAEALGVRACLPKPVDLTRLLEVVEGCMG
jgi:CheY-like chemotaxis protein